MYGALFGAGVFPIYSQSGFQIESIVTLPMGIGNIERNTIGENSNRKSNNSKCWILKRMVFSSWKQSETKQAKIVLSNV